MRWFGTVVAFSNEKVVSIVEMTEGLARTILIDLDKRTEEYVRNQIWSSYKFLCDDIASEVPTREV